MSKLDEQKILDYHHKKIVDSYLKHRVEGMTWTMKGYKKVLITDLETSHLKNILDAIKSNYGNEYLYSQNGKRKHIEAELALRELGI